MFGTIRQNARRILPAGLHLKNVKLYAIMNSNTLIEGLLQKPLWQKTGEEYCQLTHYALSLSPNTGSSPAPPGQKALGVHALAVELGCSDSTVYALMRTPREEDGSSEGGGILRPAVVSRIGRRIVFDVETARRLADDYQPLPARRISALGRRHRSTYIF